MTTSATNVHMLGGCLKRHGLPRRIRAAVDLSESEH
jgi:hypothetical protein